MMMHLIVYRRRGSRGVREILCTGVYINYVGDRTDLTDVPREATCPVCRERYETEPQPVTTKDLAEVLALVDEALAQIAPIMLADLRKRLGVLKARLERPRPIQEES